MLPLRHIGRFAILVSVLILNPLAAQLPKSDSKVKLDAVAGKPDADGNQNVTITLDIEKSWHLYANPVDNDTFTPGQTRLKFITKLQDAKIIYPEGKLNKDKTVGDFRTYEGKIVIKAMVKRMKGDTAPLEFSVKVQACDDKNCLIPAEIKKSIP